MPLQRRYFLKILAAAGVAGVAGDGLFEYAPWLNYREQAGIIRRQLARTSEFSKQALELVRYATLAASGHNTQPWKFVIKESSIEIHPDYARSLPVVDRERRELWISLGCALENLLVAGRVRGYFPDVAYPGAEDLIRVDFKADASRNDQLFEAIPLRQNTRSEYDGRFVKPPDLDAAQATPVEKGVALRFILTSSGLNTVSEYVRQGDLLQYGDKAFIEELIRWLRFDRREALDRFDGLFTRCSSNPEVPRWLGRIFVANMNPRKQADDDIKKLRSSAGAVVITSTSDDRTAWVRTGQVYERLALMLTSLNIKSALLNQPIELPGIRKQFQTAIGLGNALPQLLLRFGYAEPTPFSFRRPVEQVLLA